VSKPQSTEKCSQPVFRNWSLKWAVRTSVTLWCHSKAVTALSHAPSPAHPDTPSNLAGFEFSQSLPEFCFIFIQSLGKQSANQRRASEPLFNLVLLELQRGAWERRCKTTMRWFFGTENNKYIYLWISTLQIKHRKIVRYVTFKCSDLRTQKHPPEFTSFFNFYLFNGRFLPTFQ